MIRLNIGGMLYATTIQTLNKYGENLLTRIINGGMPSTRDEQGAYFFDRNPELFSYLLEFLRCGVLPVYEETVFQRVYDEAVYFDVDLSDAFLADMQEGLYVSDPTHHVGQNILFIERHPSKPWIVLFTGALELSGKSNQFVEYWRKCCTIKAGKILVDDDFEIVQSEAGCLIVHQLAQFSGPMDLTLSCGKEETDIDDEISDKWWQGGWLINQKPLSLCATKLSDDRWVMTITYNEHMWGPLDVRVLCSKFIVVDGKRDSFWIYFGSDVKMITYKPFYIDKPLKGSSPELNYTSGWYRFRREDVLYD